MEPVRKTSPGPRYLVCVDLDKPVSRDDHAKARMAEILERILRAVSGGLLRDEAHRLKAGNRWRELDTVCIAVIGRSHREKSTLINAMLGERFLPGEPPFRHCRNPAEPALRDSGQSDDRDAVLAVMPPDSGISAGWPGCLAVCSAVPAGHHLITWPPISTRSGRTSPQSTATRMEHNIRRRSTPPLDGECRTAATAGLLAARSRHSTAGPRPPAEGNPRDCRTAIHHGTAISQPATPGSFPAPAWPRVIARRVQACVPSTRVIGVLWPAGGLMTGSAAGAWMPGMHDEMSLHIAASRHCGSTRDHVPAERSLLCAIAGNGAAVSRTGCPSRSPHASRSRSWPAILAHGSKRHLAQGTSREQVP